MTSECICRTTRKLITALPVLMAVLLFITPAFADLDPPGCAGTNVNLGIQSFRCDDPDNPTTATCTPFAGTVFAGEEINYRATLSPPPAGFCGYELGAITITDPAGVTTDVTMGPVPCLGCVAGAAQHLSDFVKYSVDCAEVGESGSLEAAANYANGIGHTGGSDQTGISGSVVAQNPCEDCEVSIIKEVSCEFNSETGLFENWQDECIAELGDPVASRIKITNEGGSEVTSCTVGDDFFGAVDVSSELPLASGEMTSFIILPDSDGDACADQDNTVTANCFCGEAEAEEVTADGQIDCCDIQVDKQVSCDSEVSFNDVSFDPDGVNGCIGWDASDASEAEPISIPYAGRLDPNSSAGASATECTLMDTNSVINNVVAGATPSLPFLPFDGPFFALDVSDAARCTGDVAAEEEAENGNTGTLTCACAVEGNTDNRGSIMVTDSDMARFSCQTPGLEISKLCGPQGVEGTNDVDVDVENTGTASLINCMVVDEVFPATAPECGNIGEGIDVPLSPAGPFGLGPDGTAHFDGTAMNLTEDTCNKAMVTCQISESGNPEADDPVLCPDNSENPLPGVEGCTPGEPKTISSMFSEICEVGEGCLTRTPGFWQNHDRCAEEVLDQEDGTLDQIPGSIVACGMEIEGHNSTSFGDTDQDATVVEHMCVDGNVAKGKDTTQTVLNLKRHCVAAALNIEATIQLGGSCTTALMHDNEEDIADIFLACCSAPEAGDTLCSGDDMPGCIELMSDFNENDDFEDLIDEAAFENSCFSRPGPADSSFCRDTRKNNHTKGKKN